MALPAFPAFAQDGSRNLAFDSYQVVWLSAFIGAISFAVVSAAALIRAKARTEEDLARLRHEIADLKLAADRAEGVLDAEDQRVVIWSGAGEAPVVMGQLPEESETPRGRVAFTAFGQWLDVRSSQELERAIVALRARGEPFALTLRTQKGTVIDAVGRVSGARTFVRFRDLTAERRDHSELVNRHAALKSESAVVRALLSALPMPVWVRDANGRLTFANDAYARAVDAENGKAAVTKELEFLDTAAREAIQRRRLADPVFSKRVALVAGGERRLFDVVDVSAAGGSAGLANDASELEQVQADLRRTIDGHARTLDQLASAVAIFGADRRLRFYNAAFLALFGLDPAFLETAPEDGAVLDQLRSQRRLPEQADYRSWRRDMLASYQAMEAREFWWHLPGGQTLRVIADPNPQGGVTYVYENVTERLDLESRYNALIRVQGETLDHLAEAVAVFGSDGRLRLWNPALGALWRVPETRLADRPHVGDVIGWCAAMHPDPKLWNDIRTAVAGLADTRTRLEARIERRDGNVIDMRTVPLPDGATLVTFVNVTDTVNVERALVEKNEALQTADQLKNAFIQHVSYELRSPLTNIIGFAQLLGEETVGPLNPKQSEYTGYILGSSGALLAIINDILDLATVDAGIMELDLGPVDVAATVDAAVRGIDDRLSEARISLKTTIDPNVASFTGDEKRIRQILYNLLSNAVSFSNDGGGIELAVWRTGGEIVFEVQDHGRGIAADYLPSVFDRFESRTAGARRRGAGLGLAIVKSLVELHGGTVDIQSAEGKGTTVVCRLPAEPEQRRIQAAE
jgi:signal transduction histidine kinase